MEEDKRRLNLDFFHHLIISRPTPVNPRVSAAILVNTA